MNIKDYGFKSHLYDNVDEDKVARIITTHKDRFEIICNKGKGFAQIKRGAFYDNPDSIFPTTGDFVLIEWNDSGDSMIYETLKRQSSFSRTASSADKILNSRTLISEPTGCSGNFFSSANKSIAEFSSP